MIDCECGQVVQAANDDDLCRRIRDHVDREHSDWALSPEQVRELVDERAYDATDS